MTVSIKDEYSSLEDKMVNKLNKKVMKAFNESDPDKIQENLQSILQLKGQKILKYRTIISVAFFNNQLDLLSDNFKNQVILQFVEHNNWVESVDALRLLANCMFVFKIDQLDNFIDQLLKHYLKNNSYSERMIERIAIICNNYLYHCYYSQVQGKNINTCLEFLNNLDYSYHFIFYHIAEKFYYYLFCNEKDKAKLVKKQLISCGYGKLVNSWKI